MVATHELDIVPIIADRVVVLGEDRRILADGLPAAILADTDLLIRANLIHAHLHRHGPVRHLHVHDLDDGHHDRSDDPAASGYGAVSAPDD